MDAAANETTGPCEADAAKHPLDHLRNFVREHEQHDRFTNLSQDRLAADRIE